MKRLMVLASILAWIPSAAAWAQNVGGGGVFPPNEVDQIKVDMAIEKGIKYLKANNASHLGAKDHVGRKMSNRELVLFTYVHADVPTTDPDFKTLFDDMIKDKLEATYCVALQAMVLEEVQRVEWQKRILMCAKFLVDNQGPQGYWSYGSPSIYVEDVAYEVPKRKDVASGGGTKDGGPREFNLPTTNGPKSKPVVKNKVKVKKDRDGEGHDNSNTQYAALGMRACYDSGIIIEDKVIDLAMKWLRDCQKKVQGPEEELIEGGVNGPDKPGAKPGVASGGGGATVAGPSMVQKRAMPQGWCYSDHAEHEAYGSMTAGAIGSLAIWDYIKDNDDGLKKRSWKSDKDVHEGLQWLAKNFSVTFNPGPYEHAKMEKDSKNQYLYYMYALERAGMIYGTEVMGAHKWYPEGAKVLIETQGANGAWGSTVDTCFAILFLKRATRALGVATDSAAQMRAKMGK